MTLRDAGLNVTRRWPGLEPIARVIYKSLPKRLHDTPASRIAAFFAKEPAVTFVQIGAFDGIAGDPIRDLAINRPGWRGALVEPQPAAFERLKGNYAGQAGQYLFFNAAVAETAGERLFFAVAKDDPRNADLPDWASEVASLDLAHVRKHFPTAQIETRTVRSLTFSEVAAHLPGGQADLVVIDAEGYERPIIDCLDFTRHRIRFLMYEHKHLSPQDSREIARRLARAGFRLKTFGRDTIASRRT